jgi:hypothetical protein
MKPRHSLYFSIFHVSLIFVLVLPLLLPVSTAGAAALLQDLPEPDDPTNPLTPNPEIAWNTFLGSTALDKSNAIAVDGSGNVYITGYSAATWGSPLNAHAGAEDAFVAKLDSDGILLWNTFLGSKDVDFWKEDEGNAIAVDPSGNVYVVGSSTAAWGRPINAHAGGVDTYGRQLTDAFVAKLNSDGVLQWNTFLGSTARDEGNGIAVDDDGDVYVVGSSDASWRSPLNAHGGGKDAFVAKLDSNGVLQWNTFFGSTYMGPYWTSAVSEGNAIAVDGNRNVYMAGTRHGQILGMSFVDNEHSAFVVKLNSNGALQWNTFLHQTNTSYNPTDQRNFGNAIAVDSSGNVYVAGRRGGTYHDSLSAAYVAKLNSYGVLQWNTYLPKTTPASYSTSGAEGWEENNGIAVDERGNVYVAGGNPYLPYPAPRSFDAFVAKLDSSGVLQRHTIFDSTEEDRGSAIAVDGSGNVFVTGHSNATWNSPINAHAGGVNTYGELTSDIFVVKLAPVMDVQGNYQSISAGDTTPNPTDLTDFGDAAVDGEIVTHTFVIRNTGIAALTLNGSPMVSIRGANANDFTLLNDPYSSIGSWDSTAFVIQFNPSSVGLCKATISIANDDSDENPYVFAIQGFGTGAPDILVLDNNWGIIDGYPLPSPIYLTNFRDAAVDGENVVHTFVIHNNGTGVLNLNGSPLVSINGANADDFTLLDNPHPSIDRGDSTEFVIKFDPSDAGLRTATVSIANDDPDENPYVFDIQGYGTAASEMDVLGNNMSIADGDTTPSPANLTDFGDVRVDGEGIAHTFVIHNTGNGVLRLSGSPLIRISGPNADDFTLLDSPRSSIDGGDSTEFVIRFVPNDEGLRTAKIRIVNNDTDEVLYDFAIQGTGEKSPRWIFWGIFLVLGVCLAILLKYTRRVSKCG